MAFVAKGLPECTVIKTVGNKSSMALYYHIISIINIHNSLNTERKIWIVFAFKSSSNTSQPDVPPTVKSDCGSS